MHGKERTTHSDALVILAEMSAHDGRFVHVYTEIRFHEINGCQNGQIGISLAASWTTHLSNLTQRCCRHLVRQSKGFDGQGCGVRDDGDEHT